MSRPILSRPRTRVYGCNYDKGESYYKPMVDHLDRKYSGRPLFPEPRTSLADEIAARRSDIGSRDLAGSRNDSFGRDLDLESEFRPRARPPSDFFADDADTVFDSHGQRTRRATAGDSFADEVQATTRRFKARVAALAYDEDLENNRRPKYEPGDKLFESFGASVRAETEKARSAIEDADSAFRRRSRFVSEETGEEKRSPLTKWSKLAGVDDDVPSAAANRAKQTRARLNDLESEMEEIAERQAKRTRGLAESRNDSFDDLDFMYDYRGRPVPEDNFEDDFVGAHRRFKERAAAAFDSDLAELRRKRKDVQDRMFDLVDINAEIERAKSTLVAADSAFQRHATKFDNTEDTEDATMVQKFDRTRKLNEVIVDEKPKAKPMFKWSKLGQFEEDPSELKSVKARKARINSLIAENVITDAPYEPYETKVKGRSTVKTDKRKKSVTF